MLCGFGERRDQSAGQGYEGKEGECAQGDTEQNEVLQQVGDGEGVRIEWHCE